MSSRSSLVGDTLTPSLCSAVGDGHYGIPRQKTITITAAFFDHLLNCMCEQKYLHERGDSPTTRKDQKLIDSVYREARELQHSLGGSGRKHQTLTTKRTVRSNPKG